MILQIFQRLADKYLHWFVSLDFQFFLEILELEWKCKYLELNPTCVLTVNQQNPKGNEVTLKGMSFKRLFLNISIIEFPLMTFTELSETIENPKVVWLSETLPLKILFIDLSTHTSVNGLVAIQVIYVCNHAIFLI